MYVYIHIYVCIYIYIYMLPPNRPRTRSNPSPHTSRGPSRQKTGEAAVRDGLQLMCSSHFLEV